MQGHQLTLTQARPADPSVSYPCYVAGATAAPPEDCGGIPGFYAQLEIRTDPNHPDHEQIKEWLGDHDPNTFDDLPIKYRMAASPFAETLHGKRPVNGDQPILTFQAGPCHHTRGAESDKCLMATTTTPDRQG